MPQEFCVITKDFSTIVLYSSGITNECEKRVLEFASFGSMECKINGTVSETDFRAAVEIITASSEGASAVPFTGNVHNIPWPASTSTVAWYSKIAGGQNVKGICNELNGATRTSPLFTNKENAPLEAAENWEVS